MVGPRVVAGRRVDRNRREFGELVFDDASDLIRQFRQGAEQIGLELMDSFTPIQPIMIGDSARAVRLSQMLRERGIMVTAIRPPTVPAGSARLRVTLSAAHNEAQVRLLLDALDECFRLSGRESDHA